MPKETAFEVSASCFGLNSKAYQHWIEMSIWQFSGLFFTFIIPGILNLELDAIKGLLPFKGLMRWGVPIIITLIFFCHKRVELSICKVAHRFFYRYEALRRALYLLQNKKDILNEDLRPFWDWVIDQSKNEKSNYKSEAQSVVKLNLLKYRPEKPIKYLPEEPKDDNRENLKKLYEEYKKEARTTRILKE